MTTHAAALTVIGVSAFLGGLALAAPLSRESLAYLKDIGETREFSLGRPISVKPAPDGSAVLFLRSGPRSRVLGLYEMSLPSGTVREVMTPEAVLRGAEEALSVEEMAHRERMRMSLQGFVSFELSEDGSQILLPLSGKVYLVRRSDGKVTPLPGEGWIDPRLSPDGKSVAAVKNGDLYVIDLEASRAVRLTSGATETLTRGLAEFAAQEEMDRFQGFWWSPDSSTIAYQETDASGVEPHYISDPAHPDRPPVAFRYPRAGTPNARVRLGLIDRKGGPTTWVRWDAETYPYLARVVWKEARAPLTILVETRRQREEKLLTVDPRTGATRDLWTETDAAYLNLDPARVPWWLADGSAFLWSTERRGGWQLELRSRTGDVIRELTPVDLGYRGLIDVDDRGRAALVRGGPDPRETHVYRVPLDGGDPVRMTQGRGVHDAAFSKDHRIHVHHFSLLDGSRGAEVQTEEGTLLARLPSTAEDPPFAPNVELTQVGEERRFDAAIVRPRDFRADRRYPVLLDVYAGPTAKVVQASAASYLKRQWMADQGYVVVLLDGRGTPGYGRAWERAIAGNLIDVALEDQITGLKLLGRKYPELDLSRVGVTGWSFGGYVAAMAAIRRPDVFRCGAAGAPVTDWTEYDTHYTERYLDLPAADPEAYRKTSVLTYADQLDRPLLLIHGLTDDNVYCTHTLKLAEALFKAGRPYELVLLPGTHMLADPVHFQRLWTRVMDFFDTHLKGGSASVSGGQADGRPPSPR